MNTSVLRTVRTNATFVPNQRTLESWGARDSWVRMHEEIGAVVPGELLDDRYCLGEVIGLGAMGVVHLARDVALDRRVAIKLLAPRHRDAESLERFTYEARSLAQMHHPNIVQIYAFGVRGNSHYFAMEYVAGRDLGALVEEAATDGGVVPFDRAVAIVCHVANGLCAVHRGGLVHRDVKPTNIVIEDVTGRAVLIDFGIASPEIAAEAGGVGTPWYMAPEQLVGPETSARADQYALGCTAFELFAGCPLFDANDVESVLQAHRERPPPRLSSIRPGLGPLEPVLERALAKHPLDRHPSCADFAADLVRAAQKVRAAAALDHLRVLVLERDAELGRHLGRVLARTLGACGDRVEIECTSDASAAYASFADRPADVVVIDDENLAASAADLVRALRRAPGGADIEVVVLTQDHAARSPELAELETRELSKPLNMNAFADVLRAMGTRIVQRRGGQAPTDDS